MTSTARLALGGSLALLLGACTATMGNVPVDVTRYHLGSPIPPGSVSIEPASDAAPTLGTEPRFLAYADSIGAELTQLGFPASSDPAAAPSTYVAGVKLNRNFKGVVRDPPPVSIGLGGGSYGRRGGVGGGVSFGIGGKRHNVIDSELVVQLKRRDDGSIVWEGRAMTETLQGTPGDDPATLGPKLAHALFKGFPGESGVTITVK